MNAYGGGGGVMLRDGASACACARGSQIASSHVGEEEEEEEGKQSEENWPSLSPASSSSSTTTTTCTPWNGKDIVWIVLCQILVCISLPSDCLRQFDCAEFIHFKQLCARCLQQNTTATDEALHLQFRVGVELWWYL
ncbi:unnamed protein product [Hydatigera taeniaeformis]|uniref:Uncharacterized protein n=1 Tax=Hydatigena taeniaeformis TaxID=6205 RepID=A0A0R3WQL3_HYDTA|nr:unnamed protein product [Hydatigera taeniaeformis]